MSSTTSIIDTVCPVAAAAALDAIDVVFDELHADDGHDIRPLAHAIAAYAGGIVGRHIVNSGEMVLCVETFLAAARTGAGENPDLPFPIAAERALDEHARARLAKRAIKRAMESMPA